MIYLLEPANYPSKGQFLEEISYQDENDFEWRIARVKNGFFVRYFGYKYFSPIKFVIEVGEELVKIRNTNCVFFSCADFDTFCQMRNIIKNEFTDTIWEAIEEFLKVRLGQTPELLESEICK